MSLNEARRRVRDGRPSRNGTHAANGKAADAPPRGLVTTPLDGIDPEPIHWLVPGYVPLGKMVLLAGDGGHGKTTLTLHLTAALTTGRPCLGLDYTAPAPCDVLVISCEDDFADTVVPRLHAAGADLARVRKVDGVRTADGKAAPFSLAHHARLAEELADRPGVRLVIIDPAGAYIGSSGVDDHKDSDLRGLLGPTAELAAKYRCTILLVKHLNKGASAKAVHKVGGSTGYVNSVRAAFVLAPQPGDATRKLLLPLKFNIGPKPPGLAFRLEPLRGDAAAGVLARFERLDAADRERMADQLFSIAWDGVVDIDADDAFAEFAREQPTRVRECRDWLVGFLGGWAWPDGEVEAAAADAGFTTDNVRKAKTALRRDGEMFSKPAGRGDQWWNWLGGKADRKPDRPTPYRPKSEETEESEESDEPRPEASSDYPVPD